LVLYEDNIKYSLIIMSYKRKVIFGIFGNGYQVYIFWLIGCFLEI